MLRFLNQNAEELLGAVMLAVMALIAFVNVVVRYCTNFSFAWSEEMTVNLFVWAVLLGTSAVFRSSEHLGMSIFYNMLPRRARYCCALVALLMCLIFFATLMWFGTLEVLDEIEIEVVSESLGIPVWWYTMATPLLAALTIFRLLQRFRHDVRNEAF